MIRPHNKLVARAAGHYPENRPHLASNLRDTITGLCQGARRVFCAVYEEPCGSAPESSGFVYNTTKAKSQLEPPRGIEPLPTGRQGGPMLGVYPPMAGKHRPAYTFRSRWSDLNRRPTLYESVALPLSYIGMLRRASLLLS